MFFDLFHSHYWGPPRKREDGIHYMTCYECGKKRKLKVEIETEAKRVHATARPDKAVRAA
jgi:hypothetical protein